MSINLNHTIVHSRDKGESADFLVEILGLPAPTPFGPFLTVQMDNEVTLDFYDADREIAPQHYAFLVSEMEFDEILGRIRRRGAYFEDPSGHNLEIITRPYGSG
jgi:catechol 2,3-dioxygenase-like lactoylglutathione lyase family enzyme